MSNLRSYAGDTEIQKATNSSLGLVKGGADVFINDDGEMEIMNSYGGSFRVSVSGTTATIGEGRIHNGIAPQHAIISRAPSTIQITANTVNAIWIVINQNGNSNYMKTNNLIAAPTVSGEGTFCCILLAVIGYNGDTPFVQQCHFGDIIITGIFY